MTTIVQITLCDQSSRWKSRLHQNEVARGRHSSNKECTMLYGGTYTPLLSFRSSLSGNQIELMIMFFERTECIRDEVIVYLVVWRFPSGPLLSGGVKDSHIR